MKNERFTMKANRTLVALKIDEETFQLMERAREQFKKNKGLPTLAQRDFRKYCYKLASHTILDSTHIGFGKEINK